MEARRLLKDLSDLRGQKMYHVAEDVFALALQKIIGKKKTT